MFGKLFDKLSGGSGSGGGKMRSRPIRDLLTASGKVPLQTFVKYAQELDEAGFVAFAERPSLVGSSIQEGQISQQSASQEESKRKPTMLFIPRMGTEEANAMQSQALQRAIYPLVKGDHSYNRQEQIFAIGRTEDSDIVMPDFALSERHAAIVFENERYFVRDLGSTNGTTVNGEAVEKNSSLPVQDGDVIGFARYEFAFVYPRSLFRLLREQYGKKLI